MPSPPALPGPGETHRGQKLKFDGKEYKVTSITRAHYKGVQGELPFEYWDKSECTFADLRTGRGEFATIDYSEQPPLLFDRRFADRQVNRAVRVDDREVRVVVNIDLAVRHGRAHGVGARGMDRDAGEELGKFCGEIQDHVVRNEHRAEIVARRSIRIVDPLVSKKDDRVH